MSSGTHSPDRPLSEEQLRWLEENASRMDTLSLSRTLGVHVADVEKVLAARHAAPSAHRPPETYKDAVKALASARKEYQQAMALLHQKAFAEAAAVLARVIERYPEQREVVDRARIYLAVARNGHRSSGEGPLDAAALYNEAVFEKNRGGHDRALAILARADVLPDPDGRFRFLAACCLSLTGRTAEALASLKASVDASAQNRIQARLSPDLAALRKLPAFDEALSG